MVKHSIRVRKWFGSTLGVLVLALVAAGCASYGAPAQAPAAAAPAAAETMPAATATEAPAPQVLPAAGATSASPATAAVLKVAQNAALGQFLANDKGMTLYLYTKDTPNTSNCYDQCAVAWPPLLTSGAATAGAGVDPSKLGTTTRKDGSTQVTYNSWPLYYWVKDKQPGDTTGQNVGGVWFVISPQGDMVKTAAAAGTPQAGSAQPQPAMTGTVNLVQKAGFGRFLVDDKGMTLYLYTKDTPGTSNCYGGCATAWPPLLAENAPAAGSGLDASLLGTTTRTDGKKQVTYNGNPLYYYVKDKQPGDITGQGVGNVWYVVSPRGTGMTGPFNGSQPAAAPTATPASGGSGGGYGGGYGG